MIATKKRRVVYKRVIKSEKKQTNAHASLLFSSSFIPSLLLLLLLLLFSLLYSITQARQNQQLALRRIIPHPELG